MELYYPQKIEPLMYVRSHEKPDGFAFALVPYWFRDLILVAFSHMSTHFDS